MDTELRELERQVSSAPDQQLMARLATALARSGNESLAEWMRFLGGHWTMTAPTREGSYFTKARDHSLGMQLHLIMFEGELVVASASLRHSRPAERWQGYWWSEPMPSLPAHTAQDDSDAR